MPIIPVSLYYLALFAFIDRFNPLGSEASGIRKSQKKAATAS
jgi:hypothetical protein